jgi:hypothetical protein
MPRPGDDLVKQGEELAQFIRKRQQADGSFATPEDPPGEHFVAAGRALFGLLRSQARHPADWKIGAVRRALPYYLHGWKENRSPQTTAWIVSAFAEAYALTKETAFADAAREMTDWLCSLQIGIDPRRPLWQGGFADWRQGRPVQRAPGIEAAVCVLAIVDACRVAKQTGDTARFDKYRDHVHSGLQFLASLQYSPANTRHFADWYQPQLNGAFFASHQDGNVRLEYGEHAVDAMLQYLENVAEIPGTRVLPK